MILRLFHFLNNKIILNKINQIIYKILSKNKSLFIYLKKYINTVDFN